VFQSPELKNHLETSLSIKSESAVVAEWNMNIPGNIQKLGNYRYRENSSQFSVLPNFFDPLDAGNFYTGATDADVTVELGFEDEGLTPQLFVYPKDKEKLLYSLEDCLKPFRPRSGINKLSYFNNKYLPFENKDMYLRPRYYMPTKDDEFKYWRSYRSESDTNIAYPSIITNDVIVSNISGSQLNWSATISKLTSVSELPVGKSFAVLLKTKITLGSSATVTNISPNSNLTGWTATLTGLTSTAGVIVGDQITAEDSDPVSGSLFGGAPTSVTVLSVLSNTSISYSVIGGTTPVAGLISDVETVPANLGSGLATVTEILSPTSIRASILSQQDITYGSVKSLYVNRYRLNEEYGISKNSPTGRYVIEDTNPFVTYKEEVPANRIVVKVQTGVGDINLGPFRNSGGSQLADPFFGEANKSVPRVFKVEYLSETNQWLTALEFNEASLRDDEGNPIFGSDGHLSLEYGLEVPRKYRNNFRLLDTLKSASVLPIYNVIGAAYLVVPTEGDKGTLYVYNGEEYEDFLPSYSWSIGTDGTYENTHFVTDFTNPSYYNEGGVAANIYREFVWLKGIRLVVETMSLPNVPLELIEISPRLVANLSNSLLDFDVTKAASDLSGSALPVGQIMAGVGSINLFDEDQSFNPTNQWDFQTQSGSIIAKYIEKNIKFTFYEVIKDVNSDNYYVPIKTLYSETFPQRDARTGETSISLRDFYFYFESLKAPRILITEASLSQAVCLLLDSIGFSNYVFKRKEDIADPVVPYFFIPPEQSVAETLAQLARATQSAMFFDEYNNFVVMTKEYILDESIDRTPDVTLYGSSNEGKLPNIQDVASKDRKVYNAGTINYTTRYIKRVGGTIAQSKFVDKNYVYNPSLLWESSGSETTTSANNERQERFALSAVPLNTNLTAALPEVSVAGIIINNVFDIGENAYWLARFQGFFYANGEVIRYDAVEYNITGTGNVWISSNLEYQRYFTSIPFNGKIYPTGLVRIYAEPFYETFTGIGVTQGGQEINEAVRLKVGPVVAHGRGQFGTPVISHSAGLDPYWSNNSNIQGCEMDSSLIFNTDVDKTFPATVAGPAGLSKLTAEKTQRNGIIRNFLSSKYSTETEVGSLKTTTAATIQSSALIMTGPDFAPGAVSRNFVSYVHKKLDRAYKHYGTRLRIIGKIESTGDRAQTVIGGMTYFNVPSYDPSKTISVGGGSAGINIVNPLTNNGYYFEIAALTASNIEELLQRDPETGESQISLNNILFYKVRKNSNPNESKAVPTLLFGGLGNILVDDGNFAGQSRIIGEENPTVYDLAIEYVDVNSTRRDFYLYINQKIVARVTDNEPIDLVNSSVGLFVRGNAKAMFENVYALGKNFANNTVFDTNLPIAKVFGDQDDSINATEALSKYAISGMVQNTYLSGINPQTTPAYDLYFEEFGTIMRECAYFNIKYDRAYPALYAKIAPTANRLKGYTVSGFTADSYGAEFLVFNNTDTILSLDEKTGNYLRILGVAFTQDTTASLTVDDYLKKRGNLSDPELQGPTVVESPFKFTQQYEKIKQSRILYGKNDFTLESLYIQDQDTAEAILGWIIEKNARPRKSIGLNIFSMPTLQLGDMVNIYYKDKDGVDMVDAETKKYVVYNINYKKSSAGPAMTVYLSEV
jgi:hypothetical protein